MPTSTPSESKLTPLYEQLQPLRNGPSREEVIRNQRARLFGAMIETVAEHGYVATTVTELRALAGVSKRTVYDHFPSKEAYFLATYDLVVYRAVKRVRGAYLAERDWPQQMRSALRALLCEVHEQPKAASFALVEALCAGGGALRRTERVTQTFQRMISRGLADGSDTVTIDPLIAKGIVGGIACVLALELTEHGIEQRDEIVTEILGWILAFQSSAHNTPGAKAQGQRLLGSPRGAGYHVRGDPRERMLQSALTAVASNGYASLTVAQITQDSQSSDQAFFELFEDCEQCFIEAIDNGQQVACDCVESALASTEDWMRGVHLGMWALVDYLANNPEWTRAAFLEIFALGRGGVEHSLRMTEILISLLTRNAPPTERPSHLLARASTGAIWETVRHYLLATDTHSLPEIVNHSTYLVLAPLIGGAQAEAAITKSESHERAVHTREKTAA